MEIAALPLTAGPALYEQQASEIFEAWKQGKEGFSAFIYCTSPQFSEMTRQEFEAAEKTQKIVETVLAQFYHFNSWDALIQWSASLQSKDGLVLNFEMAAQAVVDGDIGQLSSLLSKNPGLVNLRSLRKHHSMLIHYTGSNGIEDYRQQTPQNIVVILRMLLDAGADINAEASMYGGGSTPLGLAATSIHPVRAGRMEELLQAMLDAGAFIDHPGAAGNRQSIVNGCLRNGRPEAAVFLSGKGASLDLEGAAGVGLLDRVKGFVDTNGNFQNGATKKQFDYGFIWACSYGHSEVVYYLLKLHADPSRMIDGLSGFHWAIIGGHLDIVTAILQRKPSLEARNKFGGTAIEAAIWAVVHQDAAKQWPKTDTDYPMIFRILLDAGAIVESSAKTWLESQDMNAGLQTEILKILQ